MPTIGETDYRAGAKERLADALALLQQERFAGSIYMAGRAVECILRAVVWAADADYRTGRKRLETGHDLRHLLRLVGNLGVLQRHGLRDSIRPYVHRIGRLWWNNMRFLPAAKIDSIWYNLGEIGGKRTMKQAAREYYEACSTILERCEIVWQRNAPS